MTSNPIIKVGMCVAYDWVLLKTSLVRIYNHADLICLGLDKDRHAWSCQPFQFDSEDFFSFIKTLDIDKKILIYEDDFSLAELDKRQNCNRHRTLIANRMGQGGWHIQIDADEYFLDFDGFTKYLKKLQSNPQPTHKPINICCPFVPVIKKVNGGYLYVDFKTTLPEIIPIATNRPDYQRARQNGHFNHITSYYVVHETWARNEEELWFKINNWGHASEELNERKKRISYYNLWKSLDENNCQYVKNFHPASATTWPILNFAKGDSMKELIEKFNTLKFPFSPFMLRLKNNRNISRIKFYSQKLIEKILS